MTNRETEFSCKESRLTNRDTEFSYRESRPTNREGGFSYRESRPTNREAGFSCRESRQTNRDGKFSYREFPPTYRDAEFSHREFQLDRREYELYACLIVLYVLPLTYFRHSVFAFMFQVIVSLAISHWLCIYKSLKIEVMNKKYLPTQNMLFQFNDFVTANKAELETNPILWELIQKMLAKGIEFNEAIGIQSMNYGGYAITKNQKKVSLADASINILNLLYNDCLKNNQMDNIKNFKSTEGQLLNMSYSRLLNYAEETVSYCDKHSDTLVAMGITEAMLNSLKEAVSAMRTYMPLPQEMIKKREEATKAIMQIAKEIDALQYDRLDKLMESFFKLSNPGLYTAYQQAVRRERAPSRALAVIGSVKDKKTNRPVTNAHVLIPEAEIDHIVRGEKGGFRISNLEAGTYPVEICAVNYKSQWVNLVHNYGETDRLDILLEPESHLPHV